MKKPRVLVLSNNCFSLSNSNGRTLGNLFYGWPKESLAQMCVIAQAPNWELCDNYYCIGDRAVLSAFLRFRKAEGLKIQQRDNEIGLATQSGRTIIGKKTLLKVMLRELVWSKGRWNSLGFRNWVDSFSPEVIVLQLGDCFFMLDMALQLSESRNIPLVIYNTEGYYFFDRNWHHVTSFDKVAFPYYRNKYRRKVEKVLAYASHSVYLNDKLKKDYDAQFHKPSTVIYNSSNLIASTKPFFESGVPKFAYLGNLGLDRDSALVEIGSVLQEMNSSYFVDVYGGASEAIEHRLGNAKGVRFHGVVSYDEVKKVIAETDVLFHVETKKGYKDRQLQYAFSTKIADSVASGRCFLVYAPKELACSKYIIHNKCGWVASNKDELKEQLRSIIINADERDKVLENAKKVAAENHSHIYNAKMFQNIIETVRL